jgi:hypothetical protein
LDILMTIIIKDWAEHFEKADNRRLKVFSWVAVPTKMDGKKFRRLSKIKNGMEVFGAFILLLELAGKMPEKGVLRDSDGDLQYSDMELMTGFPAKQFENAILILLSEEIGWLSDDTRATLGQHSGDTQPTVQYSTVQDKTIERPSNKFSIPSFEQVNDFIKEKKYSVNPDVFWHHYEGNGWMVGKNKMKNWKSAISGWEARERPINPAKVHKTRTPDLPPDPTPEEMPTAQDIEEYKRKYKDLMK